MNLICKLFGHKWKYNHIALNDERDCVRCHEHQIKKEIVETIKYEKWVIVHKS